VPVGEPGHPHAVGPHRVEQGGHDVAHRFAAAVGIEQVALPAAEGLGIGQLDLQALGGRAEAQALHPLAEQAQHVGRVAARPAQPQPQLLLEPAAQPKVDHQLGRGLAFGGQQRGGLAQQAVEDEEQRVHLDHGVGQIARHHQGADRPPGLQGAARAGAAGEACPRLRSGDFFGERALLQQAPRAATVTAVTACRLLAMDKSAVTRIMGPLHARLRQRETAYTPGAV
jgi:CRP-like cAMP-binding protein